MYDVSEVCKKQQNSECKEERVGKWRRGKYRKRERVEKKRQSSE